MKSPNASGLAVEMSSSMPRVFAYSVTASRNLTWTPSKYSARWMTVSLPADPSGSGSGVAVGAAVGTVAAAVGAAAAVAAAAAGAAVAAGAAGALVAAGAVGVAAPHAASSAAPAPVSVARKKARRENLGVEPSRSIACTPSFQQCQRWGIWLWTQAMRPL